jgi:transcription elongation factor Elf1
MTNHPSMTEEYFFFCPHCWQQISFLLDLSVREQTYIEDCEVCCNPIEVRVVAEAGEVLQFDAQSIEQ